MPRGGHNRKPRAQKIIQGTFRKDRNPKQEPAVDLLAEPPKPPTGLNRWARKIWKELAPELVDKGVLSSVDLFAFEALCVQYGIYRELHHAITHWTIYDDDGNPVRTVKQSVAQYMRGRNSQTMPEYTAMRQAFAQFKTYLEQFGLTPVSRNRIEVQGGSKDEDPMEAILNAE